MSPEEFYKEIEQLADRIYDPFVNNDLKDKLKQKLGELCYDYIINLGRKESKE